MKAILYLRYGSPDVLELQDTEKSAPADDEVLLRVSACSVNPYDWHFMRGEPYPLRLMAGLRKPKVPASVQTLQVQSRQLAGMSANSAPATEFLEQLRALSPNMSAHAHQGWPRS